MKAQKSFKSVLNIIGKNSFLYFSFISIIFFAFQSIYLYAPVFTGKVFDEILKNHTFPYKEYFIYIFLILSGFFISNIVSFYNQIFKLIIFSKFFKFAIEKIKNLNLNFLFKKGSQFISDISINYSFEISSLFNVQDSINIINIYKVLFLSFVFFKLHNLFGFLAILLFILTMLIQYYGNRYFMTHWKEIVKEYTEAYSDLEDTFKGINEIINFSSEIYEVKRNIKIFKLLTKKRVKITVINFFIFFIVLDFLRIFFELFVFAYGIYLFVINKITAGLLIVAIYYSKMFYEPLLSLNASFDNIKKGITKISIFNEIFKNSINNNKEIKNSKNIENKNLLKHEKEYLKQEHVTKKFNNCIKNIQKIEFRNVYLKMDKRLIYKDLNLTINKSDKIGLKGKSGKGKSLLLKILLKQILPDKGEILVNKIDLNKIKFNSIISKIGFSFNDEYLFDDTVINNITLNYDLNKSFNSDKIKIFENSINKLFKIFGLEKLQHNKVIENNGENISGGEKSRILMLRFLYHNQFKYFYFIDEPLTGVDNENKTKILEFLKSIFKNKTLFIISHDETILKHLCEKIIEI